MSLTCITATIPEVKTCVVPDEHSSHCDGFARRTRTRDVYDAKTRVTMLERRTEILDTECKGCLPAEAESGMLCGFHGRQASQALSDLLDIVVHLWSLNGSAPTVSEGRAPGFGPQWPMTASRIVANDIIVSLWALAEAYVSDGGAPAYLHPWLVPATGFRIDARTDTVAVITRDLLEHLVGDDAARVWKRRNAAAAMIPLIGVVRSALNAFPTVDRAHEIPVLRCRRCEQQTLYWHPPLYYLDDDRVKCRVCGAVEDRSLIEHDMLVILQERKHRR